MKAVPNRVDIQDLSADVLVLVLSLLHGQDIARCSRVSRRFSALIRSDLYLQYKIELAKNGMVDGHSSTLPTSERLQRLREYASRFRNGNFDHEDLTAHPLYAGQWRDLPQNRTVAGDHSLSTLYSQDGSSDENLAIFTPGSAQAGIQSNGCLLPIGRADREGLVITKWAIDGVQDLLIMAETADLDVPVELQPRTDQVYIHFYSLSGSKTTGPTPHPAAALPSLHFFASAPGIYDDIWPTANIDELHIAGQYAIWVLAVAHDGRSSVSVEVCNWRTGTVISRIDVGMRLVSVVPLEYPYLLVILKADGIYPESLSIHNVSPHDVPCCRVCTLQLRGETLEPDAYIRWHEIYTSDRPHTSEGHFLPDLSRSMVVLTFYTEDPQGERETHYLIPRTTLLAQMRAAESRHTAADRDSSSEAEPVPWAHWGPQGCLRVHSRHPSQWSLMHMIPFGSRFPLVVFGETDDPDSKIASVYVFDINPLAARYQRQVLAAARQDDHSKRRDSEPGSRAIIDNIEEVRPDVVDVGCSRIPYVAYRFKLPYDPEGWPHGHVIRAVVMSMTGFTVEFEDVRELEETFQTWTV